MTRGKNYVNNQRGAQLQAKPGGGAKSAPNMIQYEAESGCQRTECTNRHDQPSKRASSGSGKVDICIPFLAGKCTFEKGCRKRHPANNEVSRLLAKYKKTRCRFGDDCYTESCLFLHPKEEKARQPHFISPHNFPPLSTCVVVDSKKATSARGDSAWNKIPPNVAATPSANRVSPSPSSQHTDDGSLPPDQQQRDGPTQHPTAAWGPPPPMMMMINNTTLQQPVPMPPPHPQGYYGGPPPMMVPNMIPPITDPNTGYPLDPSMIAYHYEQQQQFLYLQQQQHLVSPYPMVAGVDIPCQHKGSPFNAEAKEFIPGMPA